MNACNPSFFHEGPTRNGRLAPQNARTRSGENVGAWNVSRSFPPNGSGRPVMSTWNRQAAESSTLVFPEETRWDPCSGARSDAWGPLPVFWFWVCQGVRGSQRWRSTTEEEGGRHRQTFRMPGRMESSLEVANSETRPSSRFPRSSTRQAMNHCLPRGLSSPRVSRVPRLWVAQAWMSGPTAYRLPTTTMGASKDGGAGA